MTLRLSIVILLLATVGCVGPSKKTILSPSEVAEWYNRWSLPSTINRGIGYQGSDEAFHYFIARPIDYFVFIQVPRDQLKLEDVRPKQQASSKGLGVHYWVDPLHDFRKKEEGSMGSEGSMGEGSMGSGRVLLVMGGTRLWLGIGPRIALACYLSKTVRN